MIDLPLKKYPIDYTVKGFTSSHGLKLCLDFMNLIVPSSVINIIGEYQFKDCYIVFD